MNVMDNILMEWAYRCPDGIVDINNPEKAKILLEILNEIGLQEEIINEIMSPRREAINILIDKYKNELGPHSRPGRIKNIGNITPEQFEEKIKATFNVEKVEKIAAGAPKNPSTGNPAFEFKYKNQDIIVVLGREAPGLAAENQQVEKLNNFIQSIGGKIDIKIGNNIYNDIKLAELAPKNKHADIILRGEKENIYIQYKDAEEASEFQQYSGIEKFKNENIVTTFIDEVSSLLKAQNLDGVEKSKGYKKEIPNTDKLYYESIFGIGSEGDKVQIVCIGSIVMEKEEKYYTIKGSTDTLIEGKDIPENYRPYLGARYASDRNQYFKHTRFGIYPKKYVTNFYDIDTNK